APRADRWKIRKEACPHLANKAATRHFSRTPQHIDIKEFPESGLFRKTATPGPRRPRGLLDNIRLYAILERSLRAHSCFSAGKADWRWHCVFPSATLSIDPRSCERR